MTKLQIKVNEPDIIPNNPWDGDKLNRKACAETLTRLLEGQNAALTISLNGEWGSGKTYLLRRWRQQLKNEGYTAIYFNAWEDDFLPDPLVAIIGQLWIELNCSEYDDGLTGKLSNIKGKLLPFLKRNWKNGFQLIASDIITNKTGIDVDKLKELERSAEASAFDDYVEATQNKKFLHGKLTELANAIYSRPLRSEDGNIAKDKDGNELTVQKPLVFIIDELDRCRPTFAIEVLERVKHLFHIDHMIFVLGIDRKQLGNSIQAVYGKIDVENYLHRFIDLDFAIPAANPEKFFAVLWQRYDIGNYLRQFSSQKTDEISSYKKTSCEIYLWHCFSLREIEQSLKIYSLLLRSTEPHSDSWSYLTPILILLKLKAPKLYQKYLSNTCSVTDIVNYVMNPIPNDSWTFNVIPVIIYCTFLGGGLPQEPRNQIFAIKDAILAKETIANMPLVAECLKKKTPDELYDSWSLFETRINDYSPDTLRMLAKKIDLVMTGVEDRR